MDHAELTTEQVLMRDIPLGTYETTKLITGTCLQLLRRYDNRPVSYKAQLLEDDGPEYIHVFVSILRDIFKEDTVEYFLALIDEMLAETQKEPSYFLIKSLDGEDTYEPFLRLLWKGNWFIQEKSCKMLSLILRSLPIQVVASLMQSVVLQPYLRVLVTILDTSSDARALAVACFDLLQFIQYHPAGRIISDRAEAQGEGDETEES